MRKIIITSLLLCLGLALFATPIRVAILGFNNDRASSNVTKSMMKRDFDKVLGEMDDMELISLKDTEKYLKQNGLTDLMMINLDQVKAAGESLGADVVLWGDINSVTSSEFNVQMRVMVVKSGEISVISFAVTNNSKDRAETLKTDLFAEVAQKTQGQVDKIYQFALQHFTSNNMTEAAEGFKEVLQIEPNHFDAILKLGVIYYGQKDYDSAEHYLQQAIELQPENLDVINLLGAVYKEQGKSDEAIELLEDLAERTDDATVWLRVGNLYADMGYTDDAIDALECSAELDPEYDKPRYRLALLYYDEEDYDAALPNLQFINDLRPDDEDIYRKLAISYQKTGRIQEAIEQYESVIVSEPENTKAYLNLAQAYRTAAGEASGAEKTRLNQKAVDTLNRLSEIDPENETVPLMMADLQISMNDYAAAQKTVQRAVELHPDKYEPYMLLFQIYQKRGYDAYNELIETETAYDEGVKSGNLIGSARDDMIRKKEDLREKSNSYFRQALDALNNAKSRTDKVNVKNDIARHSQTIREMIDSTKQN